MTPFIVILTVMALPVLLLLAIFTALLFFWAGDVVYQTIRRFFR